MKFGRTETAGCLAAAVGNSMVSWVMVMSNNNTNNKKAEFWNSDCFYERELSSVWKLYHQEERESQQGGDLDR
jgi:hypothetical protein